MTEVKVVEHYVVQRVGEEHMDVTHENTLLIDLISIASKKFNVDKHAITSLKITVESCGVDLNEIERLGYVQGVKIGKKE